MQLFVVFLFALLMGANVRAQDGTDPITLKQVIRNVLAQHPELQSAELSIRAAGEAARLAEQAPPVAVSLDVSNVAGTGQYRGVGQLETTFSVIKTMELGGKSAARVNVAKNRQSLLQNDRDSRKLDLLADAAQDFIHFVRDQHRLEIAEQRLRLSEHTEQVVSRRVTAGKSHVAESRRVAIDLARAELEFEHAQHELEASRIRLAVHWAETTPDFYHARATLFRLPEVAPFENLAALLERNPDLTRYATEARLAQSNLELAKTQRRFDLQLSGGVRYLNETSDGALVFSVSMPLGARSRAAPAIEENELLGQRVPLQQRTQHSRLYARLFTSYQELIHARTAVELMQQRVLPEAEHTARDYEDGYLLGRFSLTELIAAQQTLLDVRSELLFAAANFHRRLIEIERLTGTDITKGEL